MTVTRFEAMPAPPSTDADWPVPGDISFWAAVVVGDEGMSPEIPHVNNAEYVRWIDRLAELATDAAGFTRKWHLDRGTMWFVARHEIDYRGEAFAHDQLVAATWLHSLVVEGVGGATMSFNASFAPNMMSSASLGRLLPSVELRDLLSDHTASLQGNSLDVQRSRSARHPVSTLGPPRRPPARCSTLSARLSRTYDHRFSCAARACPVRTGP